MSVNSTDTSAPQVYGSQFNSGDIAWILTSTGLVWLMIPGVGYFYSGMARSKNALSLIMLSVISVAVVSFQVRIHGLTCIHMNPLNREKAYLIKNFQFY